MIHHTTLENHGVTSYFNIATSLCNSLSIQSIWHAQTTEQSFCLSFLILSTTFFFFSQFGK